MQEDWKKLEGTPYDISTHGRVRRFLPTYKASDDEGYVYQKIHVTNGVARFTVVSNDEFGKQKANSRGLAKAVMQTFKGIDDTNKSNPIVYIDGNPENCRLDNLITLNELLEFAKKNGLGKTNF